MLDELTNHLDYSAKEYILNDLKGYKVLVIVISYDIAFGYDENKLLFKNITFSLKETEKFLIFGSNEICKLTLLKVIMNKLKSLKGKVYLDSKTDYAFYAQKMENIDLKKNIHMNF